MNSCNHQNDIEELHQILMHNTVLSRFKIFLFRAFEIFCLACSILIIVSVFFSNRFFNDVANLILHALAILPVANLILIFIKLFLYSFSLIPFFTFLILRRFRKKRQRILNAFLIVKRMKQ